MEKLKKVIAFYQLFPLLMGAKQILTVPVNDLSLTLANTGTFVCGFYRFFLKEFLLLSRNPRESAFRYLCRNFLDKTLPNQIKTSQKALFIYICQYTSFFSDFCGKISSNSGPIGSIFIKMRLFYCIFIRKNLYSSDLYLLEQRVSLFIEGNIQFLNNSGLYKEKSIFSLIFFSFLHKSSNFHSIQQKNCQKA